jgi:hypothetical protein
VAEWKARAIERLTEGGSAELAVWFRSAIQAGRRTSPGRALYRAVCEGVLRPRRAAPRNIAQLLFSVPRIEWPRREGEGVEDGPDDIEFILDLREDRAGPEPLEAARHGVWSMRAGEGEAGSGDYAVFWAVTNSSPVVGVELVRRGSRCHGGEAVLARSYFRVFGHSYRSTMDSVLSGMSELPARACAELLNGCSSIDRKPSLAARPAPGAPSTADVARFAARMARGAGARVQAALFRHSQWNVGIVREPISRFLDPAWQPRIEWLPAPPDHTFRADPFGIARNGDVYLIYEDFTFAGDIGRIGWTVIGGNGSTEHGVAEIGEPVHLSYPYLIEYDGEVYCVPESFQSREVALYRAVDFPHRWQKVAPLLPGVAGCDPTVFTHDGVWWLACTDRYSEPNVHLRLWHSKRLEGPWTPHARNPVKSDPRSARPAGTPFVHQGKLYRPAQDCSTSYGRRVVINRIVTLTPDEFEETAETVIGPFAGTRYPDGVHTLSAVGGLTVVDGRRTTFDTRAFLAALSRGWRQGRRNVDVPATDLAAVPAALTRTE